MPLKLFPICWVMLCFTCVGNAQSFKPLINDPSADQEFLMSLNKKYKSDVDLLSGPYKKYIAEIYKERYELISDQFTEKAIVTNPETQKYLAKLVSEISKANPSLNINTLRIHFSRAWWPNASSMGEGTISFNIGLFNRLDNESQAAFVLCHELAHYFLNHSNNNINRYVNTMYSDEMQKELRQIQKEEYGKSARLEKLSKGLLFKSRRHSREYEAAADSMAIELMKNTRYDLSEAASCLALLDSVDNDKYDADLLLETTFNFPAYPFRKSWVVEEETIGFAKEEVNKKEEDSLKTHPDCSHRIQLISPMLKKYQQAQSVKFVTSEAIFTNLKNEFDLEIIAWCFESNRVSRALYYSLEMLRVQPDNPYLHCMIGKCLNQIYLFQKNHELGTITDLPNADREEKYNQLLLLIQNVRLKDIASISYHYLQTHADKASVYPEYQQILNTSKLNFNNHTK